MRWPEIRADLVGEGAITCYDDLRSLLDDVNLWLGFSKRREDVLTFLLIVLAQSYQLLYISSRDLTDFLTHCHGAEYVVAEMLDRPAVLAVYKHVAREEQYKPFYLLAAPDDN